MPTLTERIRHGWNAFFNNRDPSNEYRNYGYISSSRPDRIRLTGGNERSIVTAVYNRIAVDVSSIDVEHARVDENDQFVDRINSEFNNCLQLSANLDQTAQAFFQDIAMSMFDEGCIAIVPTDTTADPSKTSSYDILTMRTGKITQWYPQHVKVYLYNERTGKKEEIILPKSSVAIVENPFYAVMNQPNSTAKRLIRKLTLLDIVDEQNGAGKLDLIIQLPYTIKTDARRIQAENRRKDIETQLTSSKYGIAYTDGTERIMQLNRPVENQLLTQIDSLTKLLYSQLGITEEIMNGTASEEVMMNYYSRTIEPILTAICTEMKRKFLTKTARTQGQSVVFFRDPFKLVPISKMADIADKFTRNEILSSNEVRGKIGFKPSKDPAADELRNKNIAQPMEEMPMDDEYSDEYPEEEYMDDPNAQYEEY